LFTPQKIQMAELMNDRDERSEAWKQTIVPRWEVNAEGQIRNKKLNRILKPYLHNGYYAVGKGKHYKVHRLICFAFHGEPKANECVDHIDGNKLNNKVSNLRWMDWMENARKGNQDHSQISK